LACFILSINNEPEIWTEIVNTPLLKNYELEDGIWKMNFDGASSWEGDGACILLISPSSKKISFSFILEFEADSTNNFCKYEDLVLGL